MIDDLPLLARAAAVSERALALGALQPARTRSETVEEAGIRFLVHVLVDGWGKTSVFGQGRDGVGEDADGERDPFLPYDRSLFVETLPTGHICLLNKYNVLKNHLLLVTPEFVEQETSLNLADFAAFWRCLAEFDGLAFYNSGPLAGASQRHKHLQVAPLPFDHHAPALPIEEALADLRIKQGVGCAPGLPFVHAVARLGLAWREQAETGAAHLFDLYHTLLDAIGCPVQSGRPAPYNLLLTRRWMMATPRTRANYLHVPVNALGYAGSLLARNEQQFDFLRRVGPLTILRGVGVSRDAP